MVLEIIDEYAFLYLAERVAYIKTAVDGGKAPISKKEGWYGGEMAIKFKGKYYYVGILPGYFGIFYIPENASNEDLLLAKRNLKLRDILIKEREDTGKEIDYRRIMRLVKDINMYYKLEERLKKPNNNPLIIQDAERYMRECREKDPALAEYVKEPAENYNISKTIMLCAGRVTPCVQNISVDMRKRYKPYIVLHTVPLTFADIYPTAKLLKMGDGELSRYSKDVRSFTETMRDLSRRDPNMKICVWGNGLIYEYDVLSGDERVVEMSVIPPRLNLNKLSDRHHVVLHNDTMDNAAKDSLQTTYGGGGISLVKEIGRSFNNSFFSLKGSKTDVKPATLGQTKQFTSNGSGQDDFPKMNVSRGWVIPSPFSNRVWMGPSVPGEG